MTMLIRRISGRSASLPYKEAIYDSKVAGDPEIRGFFLECQRSSTDASLATPRNNVKKTCSPRNVRKTCSLPLNDKMPPRQRRQERLGRVEGAKLKKQQTAEINVKGPSSVYANGPSADVNNPLSDDDDDPFAEQDDPFAEEGDEPTSACSQEEQDLLQRLSLDGRKFTNEHSLPLPPPPAPPPAPEEEAAVPLGRSKSIMRNFLPLRRTTSRPVSSTTPRPVSSPALRRTPSHYDEQQKERKPWKFSISKRSKSLSSHADH